LDPLFVNWKDVMNGNKVMRIQLLLFHETAKYLLGLHVQACCNWGSQRV